MFHMRVQIAAMALLALSPGLPTGSPRDSVQPTVACPNTGELVIDEVKICYFTCPDTRTSIRIGADDICPPFH
jgi:hypothetical protein